MTKKEIEKIIDYLSIKGCFSSCFNGYSKMYSMTTENISGFLNKHDLKDKKVLTVAGSGDQRYNCYCVFFHNITSYFQNISSAYRLLTSSNIRDNNRIAPSAEKP